MITLEEFRNLKPGTVFYMLLYSSPRVVECVITPSQDSELAKVWPHDLFLDKDEAEDAIKLYQIKKRLQE